MGPAQLIESVENLLSSPDRASPGIEEIEPGSRLSRRRYSRRGTTLGEIKLSWFTMSAQMFDLPKGDLRAIGVRVSWPTGSMS
jgi:hypothetical protein